ncbi:MAG TPA: preprotein translocase subunit SecG [Lacipirellulaceae bacterium]
MGAFFLIVLSLLAIFLILLILVQRGRGGGLAGALGGMGGSSAFGAKAGDVFTRITIITAAIWIALSLIAVFWAKNRGDALSSGRPSTTSSAPRDSAPSGPASRPAQPNTNTTPAGEARPQAGAPAASTGPAESAESTPATPPAANGVTSPAKNGAAAPANNE